MSEKAVGQERVVVAVAVGAEARLRKQSMAVSNMNVVMGFVQTPVTVARYQIHRVHPRHLQLNQSVA